MADIETRVATLGRILTIWQASSNAGMPALVLNEHLKAIHRLSGELIADMKTMPPSTSVRVNPELGDAAARLLSDYFHGHTEIPDTPEGLD